jgi:AcrR family transcriptional regulator
MRTVSAADRRRPADLTARARIRDVAIECFAQEGFDAGLRTIASRADVSPGLITHHFGSKAALRAECDAEVLRRYRSLKSEGMTRPGANLLASLTDPGMSATVLVYVLRTVLAGGRPAREFLERLIDDARVLMAEGVDAGLLRPSRDEEARLRYLTYQSMGAMLVQFILMPAARPEEFLASLHAEKADAILPILELYTEGLLADRGMLDDYLQFLREPPNATAPPAPGSPPGAADRRHPGASETKDQP